VALTPPMGFLSWERFWCNTDCVTYPDTCICEKLYMDMADQMVDLGLADLGYEYVNIDDCWSNMTRADDGSLQADNIRFPSGIRALADYVHARGLKLGIYTDIGPTTCGGFPGSAGYFLKDAETFAFWGIDSVKVDGCNAATDTMNATYPDFGRALNMTGRRLLYACSWPAYVVFEGGTPDYAEIGRSCNYWRTYDDVVDSWDSVTSIISWWGKDLGNMSSVAGPGQWNDPDMLMIGDFGLSLDEQRAQMALWAIFAAPLYMSTDLRSISSESLAILSNAEVIAVNQDAMGVQGTLVASSGSTSWWLKPLSDGSLAVAILNEINHSSPVAVNSTFAMMGLNGGTYFIRDVFRHQDLGSFRGSFVIYVNPSGVSLLTLTEVSSSTL